MKKVLAILLLVIMLGGCGAASLSEYLTPADIDKGAVKYVVARGAAEPNEYKGYPSLYKAKKLLDDVDVAHVLEKQKLEQALQREDTEHNIHHGNANANYQSGLQRQEGLFGETGLISIGLMALGMGGTGILGLMTKRPRDITPEDAQKAITEATGKTHEELSAKEKHFIEVVKSVAALKDTYKNMANSDSNATVKVVDLLTTMKDTFNNVQEKDTRQAVAVAAKS